MTEAEWLNASDPFGMLAHVAGNASERKLRLFVCACARLVWDHLPDRIMREAVETAERHADGLASDDERQAFIPRLYAIPGNYGNETGATWFGTRSKDDVSAYFLSILATAPWPALASIPNRLAWEEGAKLTRSNQPVLLRDMLGNPLRPIPFDPRWRTSDVLGLARAIYDDRAFERMPILADALMDAGCEDVAIISHCRGDGPHVRGCWVVDLVLGNE